MSEYVVAQAAVLIVPSLKDFQAKLEAQLTAIEKAQDAIAIKIEGDTKKLLADYAAAKGWIESQEIEINAKVDTRYLTEIRQKYENLSRQFKNGLMLSVKVSGISLLPQLAQAAAAANDSMVELSRTALLLPGILSGIGASVASLVTGMGGLKDAFKEYSDAQKNAAQEGLKARNAAANVRDAYRDLGRSVKDARRELEDLNAQLRDAPLDEAEAIIRLQEARAEAAVTFEKSALQQQKDALAVIRAENDLADTRLRNSRTIEDVATANAKGVAASDSVVEATERLAKAVDDAATKNTKLSDSFAQLSPNAQQFVEAITGMDSQWTALKNAVQDRLFDGLAGEVTRLAASDLPMLQSGLSAIADEINGNFKTAIQSLQTSENRGFLSQILGNTAEAQGEFDQVIESLTNGFLQLSAAGSDYLPRLYRGLGDVMERFERFVAVSDADGSLDRWIESGIESFRDLGNALLNVGSILNSISDAFTGGGGKGMLELLEESSGRMAEFLRSDAGQQRLLDFFRETRGQLAEWKPFLVEIPGLMQSIASAGESWASKLLPFLTVATDFLNSHPGLVSAVLQAYLSWKVISPVISGISGLLSGDLVKALKGASGEVGMGFKTGGLTGAFSTLAGMIGVGGVAYSAVTAMIALLAYKYIDVQNEAAQAAQSHADALRNIANQVDETTGKLTQSGLIEQLKELSNYQNFNLAGDPNFDLMAKARGIGITEDKIVAALQPGAAGQSEFEAIQNRNREVVSKALQGQKDSLYWGAKSQLDKMGITFDDVVSAILGDEAQNKRLTDAGQGFNAVDLLQGINGPLGIGSVPGLGEDSIIAANLNRGLIEKRRNTQAQSDRVNSANVALNGNATMRPGTVFDQLGNPQASATTSGGVKISVDTPAPEIKLKFPEIDELIQEKGGSVSADANGSTIEFLDPRTAREFATFDKYAAGGRISGPGTGTSDSILARLSNGEFVINAAATRQHLPLLEKINNGELPGYAGGGLVLPDLPRFAEGGGWWDQVKEFGGGIVQGAKDAASSLKEFVTNPVESVKAMAPLVGLGGEGAPGVKDSWVAAGKSTIAYDDWSQGREATGAGKNVFGILSAVIPGAAATKAVQSLKAAPVAAKAAEAAAPTVSARALPPSAVGSEAVKVSGLSMDQLRANTGRTQVATTGGTVDAIHAYLDAASVGTRSIDVGSGRGFASKYGDTQEPNPKPNVNPTYRDLSEVAERAYDRVTNTNVLNVIPDVAERAALVQHIGRILSDKGRAVITTRGKDVADAKNKVPLSSEPNAWMIGKGKNQTFQKGYEPEELREFVQSVLGEGFSVEVAKVGSAPAAIQIARRLDSRAAADGTPARNRQIDNEKFEKTWARAIAADRPKVNQRTLVEKKLNDDFFDSPLVQIAKAQNRGDAMPGLDGVHMAGMRGTSEDILDIIKHHVEGNLFLNPNMNLKEIRRAPPEEIGGAYATANHASGLVLINSEFVDDPERFIEANNRLVAEGFFPELGPNNVYGSTVAHELIHIAHEDRLALSRNSQEMALRNAFIDLNPEFGLNPLDDKSTLGPAAFASVSKGRGMGSSSHLAIEKKFRGFLGDTLPGYSFFNKDALADPEAVFSDFYNSAEALASGGEDVYNMANSAGTGSKVLYGLLRDYWIKTNATRMAFLRAAGGDPNAPDSGVGKIRYPYIKPYRWGGLVRFATGGLNWFKPQSPPTPSPSPSPGGTTKAVGTLGSAASLGELYGVGAPPPAAPASPPALSVPVVPPKPPASSSIPLSTTLGVSTPVPAASPTTSGVPLPAEAGFTPTAVPQVRGTSIGGALAPLLAKAAPYGLPAESAISYGQPGFPSWVYNLGAPFKMLASTYKNHQAGSGYNRGIDWAPDGVAWNTPEGAGIMTRFAKYLASLGVMEQVIYQNPFTGETVGVYNGKLVGPGTDMPWYYAKDWAGHQNHIHTRTSFGIPNPQELSVLLNSGGLSGRKSNNSVLNSVLSQLGALAPSSRSNMPMAMTPGGIGLPQYTFGSGAAGSDVQKPLTGEQILQNYISIVSDSWSNIIENLVKNAGQIALRFIGSFFGLDFSQIINAANSVMGDVGGGIADLFDPNFGEDESEALDPLANLPADATVDQVIQSSQFGMLPPQAQADYYSMYESAAAGGEQFNAVEALRDVSAQAEQMLSGQAPGGVGQAAGAVAAYDPTKGAEQWRPVVQAILNNVAHKYGITNKKAWEDDIIGQINLESRGNPNVDNPNDSDGKGGTQQVFGLGQFHPETFAKHNKTGGDIRDPIAQIYAMIDYLASEKYGVIPDGGVNWKGVGWRNGKGYAAGGAISGPGTGVSDSILARVSNGEFIVRASETRKHLGLLQAINEGTLPKFNNGGLVQPMPLVPGFQPPAPPPPPPPPPTPPVVPDATKVPNAAVPEPQPTAPQVTPEPLAPTPDPVTDPLEQVSGIGDQIGSALGGIGGVTQGAQAPAGADPAGDPRAVMAQAPANLDHNHPAVSGAISAGAGAVAGAITTAMQAASIAGMGMSSGASAAAGPAIGAASGLVSGVAQAAGGAINGAVNILSSLMVGTLSSSPGGTGGAYGTPLLPQGKNPQGFNGGGGQVVNNWGGVTTSNPDEFYKIQQRKELQNASPFLARR